MRQEAEGLEVEWYIDVFFFVNFCMDAALLALLGKIMRTPASAVRILLGSGAGAAVSCLAVIIAYLPVRIPGFVLWTAETILPAIAMVWLAFRPGDLRTLVKMALMLFFEAFCMGGIMEALCQGTDTGHLMWSGGQAAGGNLSGTGEGLPFLTLFFLAAGGFFGLRFLWLTVTEIRRERRMLYPVTLFAEGRRVTSTAYLDTGNSLYEPDTGSPVFIVSEELWNRLRTPGTECVKIPFHTIGNPLGMMEGMRIQAIEVQGIGNQEEAGIGRFHSGKLWIENPVVARAPFALIQNGSYHVLLHKETLA